MTLYYDSLLQFWHIGTLISTNGCKEINMTVILFNWYYSAPFMKLPLLEVLSCAESPFFWNIL